MLKVGVIGIGSMGTTHLDVYSKRNDVKVLAISDIQPDRLTGKTHVGGNVEGQAKGGFDHSSARQYDEGMKLIADPEVELVDICLPTHLHVQFAKAALAAGKHVLVEKPLGRTSAEAIELAKVSESAKGFSMCAMCMRFWPEWVWLKDVIDKGTYGKVLGANFRRVASHPGGDFYTNGKECGGAVLDLHIHDTDFIHFVFGVPESVTSTGYTKVTGELDHIVTSYHYKNIPMVVAEGGWAMTAGYGFYMQYTVNFERATAVYDIALPQPLRVWEEGSTEAKHVQTNPGMGYEHEIAYLIDCIKNNRRPSIVTLKDAARTVEIVEAEVRSAASGKREPVTSKF